MDAQKVDNILMTLKEQVPAECIEDLRGRLMKADDAKASAVAAASLKSPMTALILSLFLGSYGIDRFYAGDTIPGVIKLLTLGCCGIWTIVDWFLIMNIVRKKNYERLMEIL